MSEAVYKVTKYKVTNFPIGGKLMQNRTQRRQRIDPIMPTPHEELLSALNTPLSSQQPLSSSATAVLNALILMQGLGTMLNEGISLVIEVYEDEEQTQRVVFATWDVDNAGAWGTLLYEFVFAKSEVTVRWFSKSVAANLPDTEERKVEDSKRCLVLFQCFLYGSLKCNLRGRVLCTVREYHHEAEGQGYGVSLSTLKKRGSLFFDVNSALEITKFDSHR